MNKQVFNACKELNNDPKLDCADLFSKDVFLEILSRVRNVRTEKQFCQFVAYAGIKRKGNYPFEFQPVTFKA
jgi:hypothetical protein